MITTSYGTWNNRVDGYALSIEQTVQDALGDGVDDYDVDGLVAAYRAAINAALPEGVSLCGDEFIGPYYDKDATWGPDLETDGRLDIRAIVSSVDFWQLAEQFDKTAKA